MRSKEKLFHLCYVRCEHNYSVEGCRLGLEMGRRDLVSVKDCLVLTQHYAVKKLSGRHKQ